VEILRRLALAAAVAGGVHRAILAFRRGMFLIDPAELIEGGGKHNLDE